MTTTQRHRDAASAAKKRPHTSVSEPRCSGKSDQRPSDSGVGECMTWLTLIGGWMSISAEGGP